MDVPPNHLPDDSIAPRLLISVGILIGIGFPIYIARIYSRVRPQYKLSWDDYSITVAEACSVAGYAFIIMSCKYGLGRRIVYVSKQDNTKLMFYFFLQVIVSYLGQAMMRVSVGFLLLRLKSCSAWKWVLWVMILVQLMVAAFAILWSISFCIPVRSQWEYVPNAKCRPAETLQIFGYVYSAISIASDLIFSLMPLTFVWRLRRPIVDKVVVGILMSMGFIATTAAIVRLSNNMFYRSYPGDPLRTLLIGSMWFKLEEVIGITAASIPYLKSPTERLLRRIKLIVPAGRNELPSDSRSRPAFHNTALEDTARSGLATGEIGLPRVVVQDIELGQAVIGL